MPNASSSRVASVVVTSGKLSRQDAQHVRQRIVGHVDDVPAAGGVDAGGDTGATGPEAETGGQQRFLCICGLSRAIRT